MKNGIPNKLICGDNLEELKKIPPESVDLIYIDPPFFSNKQYEVVWGDEAEVRSFEDRWEGGVEHYIGWLRPRVEAMYDTLKPTGSFYLHCDWHANAHIRIMLDDIFGAKNFRNEIIWCRGSGFKRSSAKKFPTKNDVIFFYTKTKDCFFEPQYKPHKAKYIARFKQDANGRLYRDDVNPTRGGTRTIYLDEVKGDLIDNVWDDINPVNPMAREKLGYPTQKPETLLIRIINTSSSEKDVVLDAFCGCGTACVVAAKLKREWIGIDISPTAIKLIERRLKAAGIEKDIDYISIGSPTTITELKSLKPFEFQNWVVEEMSAKHSKRKVGDMGIDGYMDKDLFREAAGIQVKQSESIGRNVVDNFKAALTRAKYKKGYIVALSFGKGAVEEAARLKNAEDIDIELVKVEDLLFKKVVLK